MRITRAHLAKTAGVLCAFVLIPVVGQFFISLAEERGVYKNPGASVAVMMAWFGTVTASPWFHWIGGGVIGLTVGTWLDSALKRRDEKDAAQKTELGPVLGPLTMPKPESEYVHLRHVAQLVYSRLGKSTLRDTLERTSNSEDEILNKMAGIVANYGDIFGVRPPSIILERIDRNEWQSLRTDMGGIYARKIDVNQTVYNDLAVRRDAIQGISNSIMKVKDETDLQVR